MASRDCKEPLIAVLDTSEELVDLLQETLEDQGFLRVVCRCLLSFQSGEEDFSAFLQLYDPQVVVYDIAIPYEENWRFFQTLKGLEASQGRRFVLTTTDKQALESLVGDTEALEIISKPFDLQKLTQTVCRELGPLAPKGPC